MFLPLLIKFPIYGIDFVWSAYHYQDNTPWKERRKSQISYCQLSPQITDVYSCETISDRSQPTLFQKIF